MKYLMLFLFFLSSCVQQNLYVDVYREKDNVLILSSAQGWDLSYHQGNGKYSVGVKSPKGVVTKLKSTAYPDFVCRSALGKVPYKKINGELLILYTPPAASGPSSMTFIPLRNDKCIGEPLTVKHHWEWSWVIGKDGLGKAEIDISKFLIDSDNDGELEFLDDDAYRWSGTKKYYIFRNGKFILKWHEVYKAPENNDYKLKLIERVKVSN